jgi:hypothetical protein
MKAQTVVIQFVIFFVLSLSILSALGYFFKFQSDLFREDVASGYRKLVNSYISSIAINLLDECKVCDYATLSFKLQNMTGGYYTEISFSNNQSSVITQPGGVTEISSLHNLNSTLLFNGFSYSIKTITLTLEKDKNILGIS